eukprot:COSAG01_NODE_477_length_16509_cov_38.684217_4_plen_184_part_00
MAASRVFFSKGAKSAASLRGALQASVVAHQRCLPTCLSPRRACAHTTRLAAGLAGPGWLAGTKYSIGAAKSGGAGSRRVDERRVFREVCGARAAIGAVHPACALLGRAPLCSRFLFVCWGWCGEMMSMVAPLTAGRMSCSEAGLLAPRKPAVRAAHAGMVPPVDHTFYHTMCCNDIWCGDTST